MVFITLQKFRIVVTGGSGEMGESCALEFLRENAKVAAPEINAYSTNQEDFIHELGSWRCDVSDEKFLSVSSKSTIRWAGGLDVLVDCAGIALVIPVEKASVEEWERVVCINPNDTMLANLAALFAIQGGGRQIFNFTSGAGVKGYPGKPIYAASTGAVLEFVRSIAPEWAQYNITASSIVFAISTPMYSKNKKQQLRRHYLTLLRNITLGVKLVVPKADSTDLAPVMVFLDSENESLSPAKPYQLTAA